MSALSRGQLPRAALLHLHPDKNGAASEHPHFTPDVQESAAAGKADVATAVPRWRGRPSVQIGHLGAPGLGHIDRSRALGR